MESVPALPGVQTRIVEYDGKPWLEMRIDLGPVEQVTTYSLLHMNIDVHIGQLVVFDKTLAYVQTLYMDGLDLENAKLVANLLVEEVAGVRASLTTHAQASQSEDF